MGLKASKNNKDSEFHTNWDQNFVSIGIRESQHEAHRVLTNTNCNTSIVRGMAYSVSAALSKEALKASKLLIGIDFTRSNEWTGKVSFNNRGLHGVGDAPNPYEKAMSVIGTTLAPFDEDNLITCFGFGEEITHDQEVFSFHSEHSPCHCLEETLSCYRKIAQNAKLAGPTSYAPVIEAAIDTVEKSGGQYHVFSDGQVTKSNTTSDKDLSPQEEETLQLIVNARSYLLSIVLVRVGDGPWEDMKNFGDELHARKCQNFQMVNLAEIMSTNATFTEKEIAFALAALREIPYQYKAAVENGILG
ncbi:E3 ubiquitin-protein ligase RGLG4-like [Castanea sativa]|uniref:E3 ubiquitin-protein ligase RGLG4-like n=1 Tax=Castanea sativa TaxID=21020 RepID=UPI003F64994E